MEETDGDVIGGRTGGGGGADAPRSLIKHE